MKDKILRMLGFILFGLGLFSFGALLILPEAVFMKTIFPPVLVIGALGSLAAVIMMTIGAPSGESMKCPACGSEADALIGRVNDPETKVCTDCYISEDLKKEQEGK